MVAKNLSLLLSLMLALPPARAAEAPQPYSMPCTQTRTLHSEKLNRDYLLCIGLPRDYGTSTESYPVVFVLDADYCFPFVQASSMLLADHDELRPLIIVGITYPGVAEEKHGPILKSNRTRDYTPTHVATGGYGPEFQKDSGGADRFLNFISDELIPYVKTNFRVKDDRTIVGYSYGGLFASYAMLTRPNVFQRYIVVSPSIWYGEHYLMRFVTRKRSNKARAFFAVGARETAKFGEKEMVGDLTKFVAKLNDTKYQLWIAPDETHHTIFPAAAMRGIRFVFR